MEERILAKRGLGNGHWDKKLKNNLVALSEADNYDEAKHEWIATGKVWWSNYNIRTATDKPTWVNNHAGNCLCGHKVVYHFHIKNTENDNEDCVGSEHIGSYLILREIKERTGLSDLEITEEMIQQWIDERTETMMKTAWWHTNGEHFTEMFDKIKDADLRINVKSKHYNWNYANNQYQYSCKIRKQGKGKIGDDDYRMSSIVYRWNHPDNPRRQRDGRGYPNNKLWTDLIYFNTMYDIKYREQIEKQDEFLARKTENHLRQQEVLRKQREENNRKQEEYRLEREKQRQEAAKRFEETEKVRKANQKVHDVKVFASNVEELNSMAQFDEDFIDNFKNNCDYYGIPIYDGEYPISVWESSFLIDLRVKLGLDENLTSNQMTTLKTICNGDLATERQTTYLRDLGYKGTITTKRQASYLINQYKDYGKIEGEEE